MTARLAPLQTDPWAPRFVDVERLNAHASSILARRLGEVRAAATEGELLPTTSIAVLGAAGAGKTHIFARLRRTVGPRASFVLVRPLLGAEPTLRLLLTEVMDQLRRPSFGGGAAQIDGLVGGALAAHPQFPSLGLADATAMSEAERTARIDHALGALFTLRPELGGAEAYARHLLVYPFLPERERPLVAAWLSGRDVDPEAARAAGLPGALSDVDVLRALTTLAALGGRSAPLLLAFDQLENLADASGQRVRAHGNLIAELVDQAPALTLVQLALTGEWLQHIQPALSLPQRTRVAERTILLDEPSANDRRELVRAWLEAAAGPATAGSFPSPLAASDVEAWCHEPGMTPRLLLEACRRALDEGSPTSSVREREPAAPAQAAAPADKDGPPVTLPPAPRVEGRRTGRRAGSVGSVDAALARAWRSAVRSAERDLREARKEGRLVDVERLAEVVDVTVGRDEGTAVVWRRAPGASPYLVGSVATGAARGTIVLVQGNHPRSVATALERARELSSEPLLFVRQGSFDFAPTWREVASRVSELQGTARTSWLAISDDVLAHGLALTMLFAASRSGELTAQDAEPITPVALRAWATGATDGSILALEGELRALLASWRETLPDAGAVASPPPVRPAAPPPPARVEGLGALLDLASRWRWTEAPLRWLRAGRDVTDRLRGR